MRHLWLISAALGLSLSCSREVRAPHAAEVDAPGDGGRSLFDEVGVEGAFVLHDERKGTTSVVGGALADTHFVPASTFKIPHTLIGLESGVIPGADFAQRWSGVRFGVEAWNRDHDLAGAMRYSVVWFYQEVARRIGPERMTAGLERLGYGEGDLSSGIDRFWLDDGSLRITPREQVAFLRRLHEGKLPVPRAHVELVERLIVLEEREGTVLRGKTGGALQGGSAVGWLVGYVDRGADHFTYALLATSRSADAGGPEVALTRIMPLRKPLARRLLVRAGALPAVMAVEPAG